MEATRTCSHPDGCDSPSRVRGLCQKHYVRWKRQGGLGQVCSVDDCGEPSQSRGLCHKHYARFLTHGTVELAPPPTTCSVDGCAREHYVRGFCSRHYRAKLAYGDPLGAPGRATGERSPRWKGARAGYAAVHDRIERRRGKASDHACVGCGGKARDWAYDYKCPDEVVWPERNLVYSHDVDRYQPMCTSCHRLQDNAHRRGIE